MSVELGNHIYKSAEDAKIAEVKIANDVVAMIAGIAASEVEGVDSLLGNKTHERVEKLGRKNLSKGVTLEMNGKEVYLKISAVLKYGENAPKVSKAIQEKVKTSVENMTGLLVSAVDVRIAGMEMN